jgi:post-segregation antitoxin (ccd killing protein)
LRKAEAERWLAENAEAIAYHNARIARDGMWNRDLIRF